MNLRKEIKLAQGYNWAKLVTEKCDRICKEKQYDPDLFINILNGSIFDQAQMEIRNELQNGKLDCMLTPIGE